MGRGQPRPRVFSVGRLFKGTSRPLPYTLTLLERTLRGIPECVREQGQHGAGTAGAAQRAAGILPAESDEA